MEDKLDCSLFIDNYCSKENTIHIVSEIDPLFILTGLLLKNRMKSHSDSNEYCMQPITQQIDSIEYFSKNINLNEQLLSTICNVKVIDENEPLYCVLNDDKVIEWLSIKINHICDYLKRNESKLYTKELNPNNDYLNEALSLINEYIPDYFFRKLCEKYKLGAIIILWTFVVVFFSFFCFLLLFLFFQLCFIVYCLLFCFFNYVLLFIVYCQKW